MPVTLENQSDTTPTVVNKPDMRFATTFLSTKYRDYAVRGEAIMDKATGELLFRRPLDGRYVSFNQNKKYMHELTLELRVLLTNYPNFQYDVSSTTGWYVSSDVDLVAANNESYVNIFTQDTIIDTESNISNTVKLKLSKDTNGFFCKPMSRDCDKPVIECITNLYDEYIRNYDGTDEAILAEKEKFNESGFSDSNATLHYEITVGEGDLILTYEESVYIRINEEICVELPIAEIMKDFANGYSSLGISIKSIEYHKLQYAVTNKTVIPGVEEGLAQFYYLDNSVYINYLNIMYFVDNSTDVVLNGNETIIAMLDIPYVQRYMGKMAKLKESSDVLTTIGRPADDLWTPNTMWAERFRDVTENGVETYLDSESNFKDYERYFAKGNVSHIRISTDTTISGNAMYIPRVEEATEPSEEGSETNGE